ncbi:LacI family DNA-binding transcriptional regulator [Reichenbachiella versicolor]|uniref:LacI family DNA-binding transcriptional regulator n=1 Tax=Reichenbachiella versicolor TaxID=1821036 RepID=UPI000D6DFBE5|nr:LacI family DNA-binding transcriptional regulator [Reichenbachiella versicolor]
MKKSAVTIKDLAKELGISPSTVSRALNDHPDISVETKKEVNDLAKRLNYEPNVVAQNLRSQKTHTIGVIIPEIVHFFFSTVISGIEEVAYNAGYTVMFCQTSESYEREVKDTKALLNQRIDGMIASFSKETTNFDHFKEVANKIPLVLFDRETDDLDVSKVIVDDYYGAAIATQHLIDQGYSKIAHLAGPENLIISAERKRGYEETLSKNNLRITPEYILPCFKGTMDEGYHAMKRLIDLPNRPDAVFANNDMAAYGAMKAIKDEGLNIPNDIGITGFSNWQFSSLIDPQLTTVAQPGVEMGRAAARRLILELEAKNETPKPTTQVLKTDLIIRESTRKEK